VHLIFCLKVRGWRGARRFSKHLEGKVAPGSAEFYGPSLAPVGQGVLDRIKLKRVAADKVEQTWEKSTDKGSTWTSVFSSEYSRQSP
jgi:hypothetical protein